ncbi:MAG: hypothetical protein AB1716_23425 [Planctomycetota bacterium]
MRRWKAWLIAVLVGGVLPVSLAAQEPAESASAPAHRGWQSRRSGPRPPRGEGPFRHDPMAGPLVPAGPLGQHLFGLTPADHGPLRAGEERELLAFARERMPRMAQLLDRLGQQDPEAQRRRLGRLAPRLRQLQRVFATSPELGALVLARAESAFEIERSARMLRQAPRGTPEYERDVAALRERVAQAVARESAVLESIAAHVERLRDQVIDNWVAQQLAGAGDGPGLPPRVRELVESYRNAATDEQRAAIQAQLRTGVAQRVEQELQTLRNRAGWMRQNAAEQVDRRMERLLGTHAPWDEAPPPGPRR